MSDTVLSVGEKAPRFILPASDGTSIDLDDLAGKTIVLYVYPRADTPGCTKEACGFRDTQSEFKKRKVVVLGVSPDPIEEVTAFAKKYNLNFPLLADSDHAVCEAYGVWQEKQNYGRTYMGVVRTTYIIDPDGRVAHVFEKVKAEGHEEQVLNWLTARKKGAKQPAR